MNFPFSRLGSQGPAMPIVPVSFPQLPNTRFTGLVDSGAAGTRIHYELTKLLDVDLDGAVTHTFTAGAQTYTSFLADVDLTVGRHTRRATVSLVRGWRHTHSLLGMDGFFEHSSHSHGEGDSPADPEQTAAHPSRPVIFER